jgi:hypothetical protein
MVVTHGDSRCLCMFGEKKDQVIHLEKVKKR